jgi:enolase
VHDTLHNSRTVRRAITQVDALEILDCRGEPTLRVTVTLADGTAAWADVPAGKSTGAYEASEVRDGGKRYGGRGVRRAVTNVVEEIGPKLLGVDATRQRLLDGMLIDLDGTATKKKLGANAIVGVSLAIARAAAQSLGIPLYRYLNVNAHVLPVPLVNLINGGKHASNDLELQEVCIFPVGADTFAEAMEISYRVNAELREIVIKKYGKLAANVGDEGGFAPPMAGALEALGCLEQAVSRSGYARKIVYGLDCAATHLFDSKSQKYTLEGKKLTTDELLKFYRSLLAKFPIASIEDPFAEDDVEGFVRATRELAIQIVGDDFFCTNSERLRKGVAAGAANAMLWKVNQIGTLTEALDAADLAYRSGYGVMVSERSGETEDPIIADITVALNAGQIKTGAPVRGERTAKYNRLLEIERELGAGARYAGKNFKVPF